MEPLDPARTALLSMDLQGGVLQRLPQADAVVAATMRAIDAARGHGVLVGHVRVALDDADFAAAPPWSPAGARFLAMRELLDVDAPASRIDDRVAPLPGDVVVRKTRVGAFSTTDLDEQLRQRGITTLVLAGVATSGVVLTTVREAADRDYRLVVLADATADRDPAVHDFLLGTLFPRTTEVVTVADLVAELARPA
jgi:nicotinamidase-related amidase